MNLKIRYFISLNSNQQPIHIIGEGRTAAFLILAQQKSREHRISKVNKLKNTERVLYREEPHVSIYSPHVCNIGPNRSKLCGHVCGLEISQNHGLIDFSIMGFSSTWMLYLNFYKKKEYLGPFTCDYIIIEKKLKHLQQHPMIQMDFRAFLTLLASLNVGTLMRKRLEMVDIMEKMRINID